MNKTFIFNETTPSIEVLNGVFYDRDLDPAYSGEASIDESLSLVTTRNYTKNLLSSFNGVKVFLNYGTTIFNIDNPINDITSNTASVLLTPQCQVGDTNYFEDSTIDDNDMTASKYSYKEVYYDIQAKDSEQGSSPLLHLYLKAKNPVCKFTFTVTNYDVEGESSVIANGGSINVNEVGDYFTLTFSSITNTQDGDDWLESLTIDEIAEYIKLKHPDGTYSLDIDYFTTELAASQSQGTIVLKYTLNDAIGAQDLGAFPLIPYMYNTMGVNEFAVNPASINNRSKDITSSYTLLVDAVDVDLIPFTTSNSSIQVAGTAVAGIPLEHSITENEDYSVDHKFGFAIEGAEAYSYTIKATLVPEGGTSGIEDLNRTCVISKSPYTYVLGTFESMQLTKTNSFKYHFSTMIAETLHGYVSVNVPQYWSGAFTLLITAEISGQSLSASGTLPTGQDSATWRVTVENVNQSPTWATGFDDYGTAPSGTEIPES